MSGEALRPLIIIIIIMTSPERVRKLKTVLMSLLILVHDLTLRKTVSSKGLGVYFVFYLEKQEV